jgi:hypothetical protein
MKDIRRKGDYYDKDQSKGCIFASLIVSAICLSFWMAVIVLFVDIDF